VLDTTAVLWRGFAGAAEHKEASGCTGKRDRTQYVSLPAFTERQLVSDYQLLEETQRAKVRCDAKLNWLAIYNSVPVDLGWVKCRDQVTSFSPQSALAHGSITNVAAASEQLGVPAGCRKPQPAGAQQARPGAAAAPAAATHANRHVRRLSVNTCY